MNHIYTVLVEVVVGSASLVVKVEIGLLVKLEIGHNYIVVDKYLDTQRVAINVLHNNVVLGLSHRSSVLDSMDQISRISAYLFQKIAKKQG